jgi:hypothetical protein
MVVQMATAAAFSASGFSGGDGTGRFRRDRRLLQLPLSRVAGRESDGRPRQSQQLQ